MRRLRILVVLLILWLLLFFSIERFIAPINISRVAYPFPPLMALIALMVRPMKREQFWVMLAAPIPIFLVLKAIAHYEVYRSGLPLTVTEICAISITTMLAYKVSNGLGEFEEAVAHITIGGGEDTISGRMQGQAEMYREVRRARRYHRPLSVLAVGIEEGSIQVALDRIVREAQQALMKRHVLSDVARTLCDELEDYNLITQQADRFMILLPEMPPENIDALVAELSREVHRKVGVELKFGMATFPDDAVTFESLVEKANREVSGQLIGKNINPLQTVDPIAGGPACVPGEVNSE
jgi:hypothetical protein